MGVSQYYNFYLAEACSETQFTREHARHRTPARAHAIGVGASLHLANKLSVAVEHAVEVMTLYDNVIVIVVEHPCLCGAECPAVVQGGWTLPCQSDSAPVFGFVMQNWCEQ